MVENALLMFLWCFTLALQIWAGFEASAMFLDRSLNAVIIAAIGVPVGIGCSSILFFHLSMFLGQNIVHLILHSIFLALASGIACLRRIKSPRRLKFPQQKCYYLIPAFYLVLVFCVTSRLYFYSERNLPHGIEQPLQEEISLISSFRHGCNSGFVNIFRVKHPSMSQTSTPSKWLTAFHSSMMQIGGASLRNSMVYPTVLILFSFCILFFELVKLFHVSSIIAIVSPLIAVNISGFGFFRFLTASERNVRTNDYVSESGLKKVTRFHPTLHLLYSFRSNTIVISLLSASYLILMHCIKLKHPSSVRFIAFICGLILPASEYQPFFALAIYSAILIAFYPKFLDFLIFLFFGSLIHIPRFLSPSFLSNLFGIERQWHPLAIHGYLFPSLTFWFNNAGVFIIFTFVLCWFFLSWKEIKFYLPEIAVFFIFNMWRPQPFIEHNSLVFLDTFYTIGTAIFISTAVRICRMPREDELKGVLAAIMLILTATTCLSGMMGVYRQIHSGKTCWQKSDEKAVEWIIANTPPKAVFYTPRISINIVSALAGRQVFLDNGEVLKLSCISCQERENQYANFILGKEDYKKIKYIFAMSSEEVVDNHENWTHVYEASKYIILKRPDDK